MGGGIVVRLSDDGFMSDSQTGDLLTVQGTLFPDRIKKKARAHMIGDLYRLEEDYLLQHPTEKLQRYK